MFPIRRSACHCRRLSKIRDAYFEPSVFFFGRVRVQKGNCEPSMNRIRAASYSETTDKRSTFPFMARWRRSLPPKQNHFRRGHRSHGCRSRSMRCGIPPDAYPDGAAPVRQAPIVFNNLIPARKFCSVQSRRIRVPRCVRRHSGIAAICAWASVAEYPGTPPSQGTHFFSESSVGV